MKKIILFSLALLAGGSLSAQELRDGMIPSDEGLFPFVITYGEAAPAVDYSFLLDAPAGKDGFIRVENGHFVNDKGRIRLNATNLTAAANFPTHEQAERMAARIARFGINCVRLHYMDWPYGPDGFPLAKEPSIFAKDGSERNLNPEMLDRLEYLISQFKQRGIYVNVNLYVARYQYHYKGQNAFNPDIQAKEKEYAKDLLTHVNPYTGLSLAEDPCVAVIELNNEDALFTSYLNGSVRKQDWPAPAELKKLPEDQRRAFFHTLEKLESDHWNNMRTYLRDELGVKVPITSTQVTYTVPSTLEGMDYYDNHAYWRHPRIGVYWKQENVAMVNDPNGGTLTSNLIPRRYAGKPYTVSEYNHPYPSFFGAEGQPILHAYAAFQGWDGVFAYSWNNRMNEEPQSMEYFFSYAARTDCLAHFIACSAMFLRGDVAEDPGCLHPALPLKTIEDVWLQNPKRGGDIVSSINRQSSGRLSNSLMLTHKTAIDLHGDPAANLTLPKAEEGPVKTAVTGQLEWNNEIPGSGMFLVRTPNVKLFSGFPAGRVMDLGNGVSLIVGETKLGWATVSLTSREGNGFAGKGTSLLVATGYTHNKDAVFTVEKDKDGNPTKAVSSRWYDWGTGPIMTEGIPATVILPSAASTTKCWALDESGNRVKEVPVKRGASGKAVIEIGPQYRTVWYEITVQ